MTLRIQCPSCQRQFQVSEELKGRTVECGACEEQFQVTEDTLVPERDRYFPGDIHKKGLDRYAGGAPPVEMPVGFQTTAYKQNATAADVIPAGPQRRVAHAIGVLVQILFAMLLVFGSQANGILKDMVFDKRVILSGFVAVVGAALIIYGGFRRKKEAFLTAFSLGTLIVVLSLLLPVPSSMRPPVPDVPVVGSPDRDLPPSGGRRLTEAEIVEKIHYGPVKDAMEVVGFDSVVALWVPVMEERYRYQIQRFLQRTAAAPDRPSFYKRDRGWLIVIQGTSLTLPEIEALVLRFGQVTESYPEIRLLQVSVEGERLQDVTPDLRRKLTDSEHPAYYARNQSELDHINIDRVKEAAQRLAATEPKRFRPQIAKRLRELLLEEGDGEFKADICRALAVWAEPNDGSLQIVSRVAQELLLSEDSVPRPFIEFLVQHESSEVVPLLVVLWSRDTGEWESLIENIGSKAEGAVAAHLSDENKGVQQSAARLLRRIGTSASLAPLKSALQAAAGDADRQSLIRSVIESIESGS